MADDAYYRQVLRQMQDEFTRAVAALEKQVAALTQHNALLTSELETSKRQQESWLQEAELTVSQLQRQLQTQEQQAKEREQALRHEVAALKSLLQQEQDYWKRYDQASKEDRDRLNRQLAEARAEGMQHHEKSQRLRSEMKALRSRVDVAVSTSTSFEQRLQTVVKEKAQEKQELETQLAHYKKKLHEKRAQNKYLTEALVRLQERRSGSSSSSPEGMKAVEEQPRRVRKRELTLPEEIKATAASATTASRLLKSKRLSASRAGTSPTASSPEISPRSAPYRRPPSVATTTPTTSDGNSFNNSSNGSLRSLRSMRNVTGRRISSRNSSDSDNIDVSPRRSAGAMGGPSPTSSRLQRELSGLRRKLDACLPDAARW